MATGFDLAERGFCPVRWRAGQRPETFSPEASLGLVDLLLHAHRIEDVEISPPPALSGFLRILAVLTGRITGLDRMDSFEDWEQAREDLLHAGRFDETAIRRYFDEFSGRFELFHTATAHPFLQDARLLEQCRNPQGDQVSSGVNKLVLNRAAGQAFVWHSHTVDADPSPVPAAEAVWSLLTWLYYGPPGRCTARQVGKTRAGDTKSGPLRGTVSYHPVGKSLFHTLVLGLPYVPWHEHDAAPWEEEPRDPLSVPPPAQGLARKLTGRFRHAVLLTPSESGDAVVDARITWAWREEHAPAEDPYVMHRVPTNGGAPIPESASATRAVWRDLDALLGRTEQRRRPEVLAHLDELAVEEGAFTAIRALGFDQDRSQAKERQYFSGITPPVLEAWQARDPRRWAQLREAREAAEQTARRLQEALSGLWQQLSKTANGKARDRGVPWLHKAMTTYWQSAERCFWEAVHAEEASAPVRNRMIEVALRTYDDTTADLMRQPKQVKAVEEHRRGLWRGWRSEAKANGEDDG